MEEYVLTDPEGFIKLVRWMDPDEIYRENQRLEEVKIKWIPSADHIANFIRMADF